jgi:hypothetical protein
MFRAGPFRQDARVVAELVAHPCVQLSAHRSSVSNHALGFDPPPLFRVSFFRSLFLFPSAIPDSLLSAP